MTRREFMAQLRKAGYEWVAVGVYGWRHTSIIFYMDKRVIFNGASRPRWEVWAEAGKVPDRHYVEVESEVALLGEIDA